jgi:hypothetical protein
LDDRAGVLAGVEAAGGADLARQRGRLGRGEVGGVHAEERVGGGGDAVGPVAEVDLVEVAAQEVGLAVALLEGGGVEDLADLAEHRPLAAGVVELGQLLGDRAAALGVAERRRDEPPDDGQGVDAAVVVEVGVLGGQHGPLDGLRDGVELDDLAAAVLPGQGGELRAVGGQHPGGVGETVEVRHERGDGRRRPQDEPAGPERHRPAQRRHGHEEDDGDGRPDADAPPRQPPDGADHPPR